MLLQRALWIALLVSGVGCGRTSLFSGLGAASEDGDGGAEPADSLPDVPRDGGRDSGPDSGRDATPDSGRDGGPDSGPDIGVGCANGCSALDDNCNIGVCDVGRNVCQRVARPNGTGCDDGNTCTSTDRCASGRCTGNPVSCNRLDTACAVGVCDPNFPGGCRAEPVPDGTPCDDGVMCTGADRCLGGACRPSMASGACGNATAIPIAIFVGTRFLSTSAACATDEIRTSCGRGSGRDVAWSFMSDGPRVLRVETDVASVGASIAFQGRCGATGTERGCARPVTSSVSLEALVPQGPTFVGIDPGAGGSFPNNTSNIVVTIDPHDVCGGAIPLRLPPVGGRIEHPGTTSGAHDDFQTICAGNANSPDHVYQLDVSTVSRVRLTLEPPPNGMTFDSALYVLAAPCAPGAAPPLACDDDGNGNLQPLIETTLMPGRYFVVVDGFASNNAGEYLLRISNEPLSTSFTFPNVGDATLQQNLGGFAQDGDFVEGVRRPSLPVARQAAIDLNIDNALMCDSVELSISVNGVTIGDVVISPGQPNLMASFMFPNIPGPNYALRYEVQGDVDPNCGFVNFPLGVSTFRLGF